VEPFVEFREALLAPPLAEAALFPELLLAEAVLLAELCAGPFAAGVPLTVPVALACPADFGAAWVFPFS
jgi:orotate phosphoribosyltransferase